MAGPDVHQNAGDRSELVEAFAKGLARDLQGYRWQYRSSLAQREAFWAAQAARLDWDREPEVVVEEDFGSARVAWFDGAKLNAAANVLRWAERPGAGARLALGFLDRDGALSQYSFAQLAELVPQLAAALAHRGLAEGDRLAMSLPDGPEAVLVALACAWLGAIYVPLPLLMPEQLLQACLRDCQPRLLLSTVSRQGDLGELPEGASSLLFDDEGEVWATLLAEGASSPRPEPASVGAEHPLFLLYAKSSAGKPRGSVFASGGYLVQAAATHGLLFEPSVSGAAVHCTVPLASSAGQAHGLWGALVSGAGLFLTAEGAALPPSRLSELLQAARPLMLLCNPDLLARLKSTQPQLVLEQGFELVVACDGVLSPRLHRFAGDALTKDLTRVIDLWIQTEAGAALLSTGPSSELNRPGSLGLPLPGIEVMVVDDLGRPCRPNQSGQMLVKSSWPAMLRSIWGQPERYRDLYFRRFQGRFHTNDGARVDGDGFFWFMGRLDDVVKVQGQTVATSEVEAALVSHPKVAEAAVVGVPEETGASLTAFVVSPGLTPGPGEEEAAPRVALAETLREHIRLRVGEFAQPARLVFTTALPRTRSGKVVRRVLRRAARGDLDRHDDLSIVANPEALNHMIKR